MAATSHRNGFIARGVELAALVALILAIGLCLIVSLFLGPILLFPVIILAMVALAIAQLWQRSDARQAAEVARIEGARGEVTYWGRVEHVSGECPTGRTPHPGQLFAVAGGQVWPALCVHAQRVVLEEAARIERGEVPDEEPVRYHDVDHAIEIALHKEPHALQAAA